MASTFGGLSLASSALAAQRRAIDTIGQNVANINTDGYSRQRVDMASLNGGSTGIHTGTIQFGSGVDVAAQTRIVDTFIIERAGRERAAKGSADTQASAFRRIEAAFNEPGGNGLAAQLEGFWSAWDAVVDRPEDLGGRAALLQKASAVTDSFRQMHRQISVIAQESIQQASAHVDDINVVAKRVAELNGSIAASIDAGVTPNELLDERDRLVGRLSERLNVTTRTDDRGMMNISVGGNSLVNGVRSSSISLDTSTPGSAVLRLSATNTIVQPTAGSIPALLHVANTVVPDHLARLDQLALSLTSTVNTQHALGQDLAALPAGVGAFFSATGAADLSLDAGIKGRPDLVGAATLGAGRYDGSNAAAMAQLSGLAGGPDEIYRSMVAQLGIDAGSAYGRAELQDRIVAQVDNERMAVSGVSLDEEMTNLVAFQQAYQAAARFMTAVDEMLERLISGTGQVGR